jgi:hypothetical protein
MCVEHLYADLTKPSPNRCTRRPAGDPAGRRGVLVRTEETHAGTQIEQHVPLATEFLGIGLESWLADLKTTAEAQHCD